MRDAAPDVHPKVDLGVDRPRFRRFRFSLAQEG
jgi:hypothetical protein